MVIVNGQNEIGVNPRDRGLHYGDGVFETINVHVDADGVLHAPWLSGHHHRLSQACLALGIDAPSQALLSSDLQQLSDMRGDTKSSTYAFKVIVSAGSSDKRGYARANITLPTRISSLHEWHSENKPITLGLSDTCLASQPQLHQFKHLNRLPHVLAANQAVTMGVDDCLMEDVHGHVIESSKSNVFFCINQQWLTPDLGDSGLPGIARAKVLQWMNQNGLDGAGDDQAQACQSVKFNRAMLTDVEAAFCTNAMVGVLPVSSLVLCDNDASEGVASIDLDVTNEHMLACQQAIGMSMRGGDA